MTSTPVQIIGSPLSPYVRKVLVFLLRTPPGEHRAALAALGVPLTAESHATATPRRGVMQP